MKFFKIIPERWILERCYYEYDAGGNGRKLRWHRVSGVYDNYPSMPLEEAIKELHKRTEEEEPQYLLLAGRTVEDGAEPPGSAYRIRRCWSKETIYPEALGL